MTQTPLLRQLALIASVAIALTACKDQSPPPPTVTGSWSGNSSGVNVSLTMAQNGSTVTGSGQMNGGGGAVALTVNGTFVAPTLSVSLTSPGYEPINYSGSMNSAQTQLVGTMNGSGFIGDQLTLTKQ